jgi:hypothetical protein
MAGGVPVSFVAKWDGSAWSALTGPSGTGANDLVVALAAWDDGSGEALYAGGQFTMAGGVTVNRVAKWDGSTWSALAAPAGTGTSGSVRAFVVWDDGTGEALYAGGGFETAGGVTVNRVAKWDGNAWSGLAGPAGTGTDRTINALAVWDDGSGEALYVGADVNLLGGMAGGVPSTGIGHYACADVDAAAPQGPSALASSSHTTAAWSADPTIDMSWSGAADEPGGSGLDRYRVLFDDQPTTVPDESTTVPHTVDPHSITSAPLADGTWYFHLSTCDVAGNCSSAVHRGPFWIDTSAPSTPTGVDSTSHEIGTPSNDPTLDVEWEASSDALSGVDGYAWTFLAMDTWSCDGVVDGSGLSATSAPLSSGEHWFHVCTVDLAGNQSAVTTIGPFELDLIAPSLAVVDTVADTGDGQLEDGETTAASITQLLVTFDEVLAEASAQVPANWSLVATGADGVFDSVPCGPTTGDLDFQPASATPLAGEETVRLDVGGGLALPAGIYRFAACPAVTDPAGNSATAETLIFEATHTNLFANPNFDDDLFGWAGGGSNPGGLGWSPVDAEGKPTSGSLEITTSGVAGSTTVASTCIEVLPGQPIVVGGALLSLAGGAGTDATVRLSVTGSAADQCAGLTTAPTTFVLATAPTAGWVPFAVTKAGSFSSVKAELEVESGTSAGQVIRVDLLILGGPIFADGFESGDTSAWSGAVP